MVCYVCHCLSNKVEQAQCSVRGCWGLSSQWGWMSILSQYGTVPAEVWCTGRKTSGIPYYRHAVLSIYLYFCLCDTQQQYTICQLWKRQEFSVPTKKYARICNNIVLWQNFYFNKNKKQGRVAWQTVQQCSTSCVWACAGVQRVRASQRGREWQWMRAEHTVVPQQLMRLPPCRQALLFHVLTLHAVHQFYQQGPDRAHAFAHGLSGWWNTSTTVLVLTFRQKHFKYLSRTWILTLLCLRVERALFMDTFTPKLLGIACVI